MTMDNVAIDINGHANLLVLQQPCLDFVGGAVSAGTSTVWVGDDISPSSPTSDHYIVQPDTTPRHSGYYPYNPNDHRWWDISPNPDFIPGGWTTTFQVTDWRVALDSKQNVITLAIDVPGIKADDLNLEIEDGVVKFAAVRPDTGIMTSNSYTLGAEYDAKTVIAELELGVLTVTAFRKKDSRSRKIPVKEK